MSKVADESAVSKSLHNAGVLMLVQVFSKMTTFTLNFMVARIVTKDIYGYANI
jgi:O-antigen/teichoic acid export membrane protein